LRVARAVPHTPAQSKKVFCFFLFTKRSPYLN
jgi:hypothetical protein